MNVLNLLTNLSADNVAILTLYITMAVAIASLITAIAAYKTAKIAAREFQQSREPLLYIDWTVAKDPHGLALLLNGIIREAANRPTTLHYIEVSHASFPSGTSGKGNTDSAPFQLASKGPINTTVLGEKLTHPLQVLVDPKVEFVVASVIVTASAGGQQETRRYDTNIRYIRATKNYRIHTQPAYRYVAQEGEKEGITTRLAEAYRNWKDEILQQD